MSNTQVLDQNFYDRPTGQVAKELLGKYLVRQKNKVFKIGKIVETEAYPGPHDLAAHSRFGKTGCPHSCTRTSSKYCWQDKRPRTFLLLFQK